MNNILLGLYSASNMWFVSVEHCYILPSAAAAAVTGSDSRHKMKKKKKNQSGGVGEESAAVRSCSTCQEKTKHIPPLHFHVMES